MSDHAEKLIRMANQIATFFKGQEDQSASSHVADHLKAFWTPAMRADLAALVAADDPKLDPVVSEAVRQRLNKQV
jgi:formate dehydrogenase subunit delta